MKNLSFAILACAAAAAAAATEDSNGAVDDTSPVPSANGEAVDTSAYTAASNAVHNADVGLMRRSFHHVPPPEGAKCNHLSAIPSQH